MLHLLSFALLNTKLPATNKTVQYKRCNLGAMFAGDCDCTE